MNKNVLFMVNSQYQLFNAIVLCATECRNEDCDLLVKNEEVLNEDILVSLHNSKLFKEIIVGIGSKTIDIKYDKLFVASPEKEWKMIYQQYAIRHKQVRIVSFGKGENMYSLFDNFETVSVCNPFSDESVKSVIECIYGPLYDIKGMYVYLDDATEDDFDTDTLLPVLDMIGKDKVLFISASEERSEKIRTLGIRTIGNNKLSYKTKIVWAGTEGNGVIIPSLGYDDLMLIYGDLKTDVIILDRILKKSENDLEIINQMKLFIEDNKETERFGIYMPDSMEELKEVLRYFRIRNNN
ncbi:MAG: hypothetical protein IJD02_01920 [Lachnospiraceae bacterium]|nr:hypothetical protein [Lachnospiraceae bacterium]